MRKKINHRKCWKAKTLEHYEKFLDLWKDADPGIAEVEMLGHAGTTGGFQSFIYYLPTQNITVSGIMNNTESNQYQILLPVLEILVPDFASQR